MNRRNLVLKRMESCDYITEAEYDSISQIPIDMSHFGVLDHRAGQATYFREFLRGEMHEWAKTHFKQDGTPYNIYKDGLRIYTTIDSRQPTRPTNPDKPSLPQTGQLWWPVPVLFVVGVVLILLGVLRRRSGKKHEDDEAP